MTIKECFDSLVPGCRVRTEALKILRAYGMPYAIDYLKKYTESTDYSREMFAKLARMETTNWHKQLPE